MEVGDFIALEWPSGCAYWRNKETIAFMEKHKLKTVKFHGCMLGVVSRKTQTPIKKPWTIATNCEEIIQEFNKFKCDKTHEHAPCAGQDTKLTENYSKPFAAAFHRGFARACQRLEAGEGESHETNHNKTNKTEKFSVPACCTISRFPVSLQAGVKAPRTSSPSFPAMASSSGLARDDAQPRKAKPAARDFNGSASEIEKRWLSLREQWSWPRFFIEAALSTYRVHDRTSWMRLNGRYNDLLMLEDQAAETFIQATIAGQTIYANKINHSDVY